jgi:hypothetical protein
MKESRILSPSRERAQGWHGWLGLLLIAVFWPLNWMLPGLRTHLLFAPLWLGYALAVDALVLARRGTSIFSRSPKDFALLFLFSAPAWWLFELINWRTGNWQYLGREHFGDLTYFLLASIAFSTVMPAVFETAELVRSFRWVDGLRRGLRVPRSQPACLGLLALGFAMLGLVLAWPTYFYPFVWGAVFCILEPVNVWLGRRSLLDALQHGDWRSSAASSGSCGITTPIRNGSTIRQASTFYMSSRCR